MIERLFKGRSLQIVFVNSEHLLFHPPKERALGALVNYLTRSMPGHKKGDVLFDWYYIARGPSTKEILAAIDPKENGKCVTSLMRAFHARDFGRYAVRKIDNSICSEERTPLRLLVIADWRSLEVIIWRLVEEIRFSYNSVDGKGDVIVGELLQFLESKGVATRLYIDPKLVLGEVESIRDWGDLRINGRIVDVPISKRHGGEDS